MKYWIDGPRVTLDLVTHIAQTRSIKNLDRFLTPRWPEDLHDPMQLPDCEKAIQRILAAIKRREKIGIIGDYDMDGTPGAVLLWQFFKQVGITPTVILPTREEGYGFSPIFVDRLVKEGITLVITVDCGIRDSEAVAHANAKKADVIIIDHHECGEVMPPALAIINPKRPDSIYPFRDLCAAGVAFKFLQALVAHPGFPVNEKEPCHRLLMWSLDLVGMATIGDMVPMIDENRLLATYGLKVLRKGQRIGLTRFIESVGLAVASLHYQDIAYKIIPKLNASGRLEAMDDVFTLLSGQDKEIIDAAIKRILTRDTQRQLLTTAVIGQATSRCQGRELPSVLIVYDATWHPGITGLVASRLSEAYERPVGVFGSLDGQNYRGSLRSYNGIALPALLTQVEDVIEKYGGHNEAAGVSIAHDKMQHFKERMEGLSLPTMAPAPFTTDGTLSVDALSLEYIAGLYALMPWGVGHPEPMWSIPNTPLSQVKWIGEQANHLKATIGNGPMALDVICFGAEKYKSFDLSQRVDIYGTLTINEFRGIKRPQLFIKGLALTDI